MISRYFCVSATAMVFAASATDFFTPFFRNEVTWLDFCYISFSATNWFGFWFKSAFCDTVQNFV